MDNDDALLTTIDYCIASKKFRLENKPSFISALTTLEQNDNVITMEKTHLLGVLFYELNQLELRHRLSLSIEPYILAQHYFNKCLKEELSLISENLATTQIRPILLKGPAYWENIYREDTIRKINDLDILIHDGFELSMVCDYLETIGYCNTDNDYRKTIYSNDHYEISPFIKNRICKVNDSEAQVLRNAIRSLSPVRIEQITDNEFLFEMCIELHKCLFLLNSGLLPAINPNHLKASEQYPSFRLMRSYANLPYLASKFVNDAEEKKHKALKLVGDFVRLLEIINPHDISKSIELAEEWSSSYNLAVMFSCVSELTPEISYNDLPDIQENPLRTLIDSLIIDSQMITTEV